MTNVAVHTGPDVADGIPTIAKSKERRVILAASIGAMFEWYDFFLYGSLAAFFGTLFFPQGSETAGFLASLATFGAGFAVRPVGAILFGRLGDTVGRKFTFLATIVLMGGSTAAIGFIPTFETWGWGAPVMLATLRLLQGLALGGEYGGAAIYVAEHAPNDRRGYQTSWIQTTATLGFLISLIVILACRLNMSSEQFTAWGWRIPFLASLILLAISIYVRMQLSESPVFQAMKDAKSLSKQPVRDSFTNISNIGKMLVILFGAHAGQSVVWYTCQFYALFFLINTLKLPFVDAYLAIAAALVIGMPFFPIFGWLSDKLGRKWIILASCALSTLTFFPIFEALASYGNPSLAEFQRTADVRIAGRGCNFSLFAAPATACDKARDFLIKSGISYTIIPAVNAEEVTVMIAGKELYGFDQASYTKSLKEAGYPGTPDPSRVNKPALIALLAVLIIYVAMGYGPLAAYFVELFPARIRFTSMSLPYHIGSGWFGGFSPFISAALVVQTGNIFAGLWYPVVVAGASVVIGGLLIRETRQRDIRA